MTVSKDFTTKNCNKPSAPAFSSSCDIIDDHLFLRKYQVWLFERMLNDKVALKFEKTHLIEVQALIEMKKLMACPEFQAECIHYFGLDITNC